MKSQQNASISFGLLNVPVKVYGATQSKDIAFKLCDEDGSEVEQVYRRKDNGDIIGSSAACARSWEGAVIDKDAISQINADSTVVNGRDLKKTIQVEDFIPIKDIPFERVRDRYFIGPDKGDTEAFGTLVAAMEKKKVGLVTKFVLKGRQHPFVLYVKDGILNAVKLAFADAEVETTHEVEEFTKPEKKKVDMAVQMIEALTKDGADTLNSLTDTLVEKKIAMAQEAIENGEVREVERKDPEDRPANDLMAVMKASIAAAEGEKEPVAA